jgi:hypothetical protein
MCEIEIGVNFLAVGYNSKASIVLPGHRVQVKCEDSLNNGASPDAHLAEPLLSDFQFSLKHFCLR